MKLKRLVAGVLSAAMMLSIGSTLAFAATDNSVTVVGDTMTFNSTMYLGTDAVAEPSVVYTYSVSKGDSGSYVTTGSDGTTSVPITVFEGVVPDAGISATAEFVLGTATSTSTVTKQVEIDFSTVTFTAPGVYHYVITESNDIGDKTGFENETDITRDVYITVEYDDSKVLGITNIIMTTNSFTDTGTDSVAYSASIKSEGYVHSYGVAGDGDGTPDPDDSSNSQNFVVTDIALGSMASRDLEFDFATAVVSTTAEAGTVFKVSEAVATASVATATASETYAIVGEDGKLYEAELVAATSDSASYYKATETAYNVKLSSGEAFVIFGVVEDMSFTVTISEGTGDSLNALGYSYYYRAYGSATGTAWTSTTTGISTTYAVDGVYTTNEGVSFATVKGEDDTEEDDTDIVYSASFPDTGVVLDLAPYAIMMVLAAGFITFRFVNVARKTEE